MLLPCIVAARALAEEFEPVVNLIAMQRCNIDIVLRKPCGNPSTPLLEYGPMGVAFFPANGPYGKMAIFMGSGIVQTI